MISLSLLRTIGLVLLGVGALALVAFFAIDFLKVPIFGRDIRMARVEKTFRSIPPPSGAVATRNLVVDKLSVSSVGADYTSSKKFEEVSTFYRRHLGRSGWRYCGENTMIGGDAMEIDFHKGDLDAWLVHWPEYPNRFGFSVSIGDRSHC